MNTESIRALEARYESEIANLRAQLETLGAGEVSGRLMGAPTGWKLVPIDFLQAFNALAHNYALNAIPPDYYKGTEGDAFKCAYKRCGQELAEVKAMLSAAPLPPTAQPSDQFSDVRNMVADLIPQDSLFVCPQMGNSVTRVKLQPAEHIPGAGEMVTQPTLARSFAEWHEDDGDVTWWASTAGEWAGEAAWIGSPLASNWPGYHTHWTPHPDFPKTPTTQPQQSTPAVPESEAQLRVKYEVLMGEMRNICEKRAAINPTGGTT